MMLSLSLDNDGNSERRRYCHRPVFRRKIEECNGVQPRRRLPTATTSFMSSSSFLVVVCLFTIICFGNGHHHNSNILYLFHKTYPSLGGEIANGNCSLLIRYSDAAFKASIGSMMGSHDLYKNANDLPEESTSYESEIQPENKIDDQVESDVVNLNSDNVPFGLKRQMRNDLIKEKEISESDNIPFFLKERIRRLSLLVRTSLALPPINKVASPSSNETTVGIPGSFAVSDYGQNQSTVATFGADFDLMQFEFDDAHLSLALKSIDVKLREIERFLEDDAFEMDQLGVNFYDKANQALEQLSNVFPNESRMAEAVGHRMRFLYEQLLQQLRDYYGQMYETYLDTSDETEPVENNAEKVVESFRRSAQNAIPSLTREGGPFHSMKIDYVVALGGLMNDMMKATEMRQQIAFIEDDDNESNYDGNNNLFPGIRSGMHRRRKYLTEKQRKLLKKIASKALVLGINYLQGWLAWQGIRRAAWERERSMPKFPLF